MRPVLLVLLSLLILPLSTALAESPSDAAAAPEAASQPADTEAPSSDAAAPAPDAETAPASGDAAVPVEPSIDGAEDAPAPGEGEAASAEPPAEAELPAWADSANVSDGGGGNELDFSMGEALKHFTPLTWAICFCLLVMSVASLAVAINRALYFFRARTQSVLFATTVTEGLGRGDVDGVLEQAGQTEAVFSYLARIVSAGLSDARDVKEKMHSLDQLDTVGAAMERTIIEETVGLRKWLTILATTASTAPFVGLLGTVFGIINSFKGMASSESAGISAVAGGIAEALYMTGLGLVVAIPAVWLYNWANARVDGFEAEMANASSEMLDWVKKNKSSI
jgi:biopolymer transport protein ExbB/TolQ